MARLLPKSFYFCARSLFNEEVVERDAVRWREHVNSCSANSSCTGVVSTFLLQTAELAAYRSGNLINVEGNVLGIAEGCSRLRMLVVFFALTTAVALVAERHWLQKFILVMSAAGVALFCNILRITVTDALSVYAGPKLAETVSHDLAGWLMIPLALAMLWGELQYLQR